MNIGHTCWEHWWLRLHYVNLVMYLCSCYKLWMDVIEWLGKIYWSCTYCVHGSYCQTCVILYIILPTCIFLQRFASILRYVLQLFYFQSVGLCTCDVSFIFVDTFVSATAFMWLHFVTECPICDFPLWWNDLCFQIRCLNWLLSSVDFAFLL